MPDPGQLALTVDRVVVVHVRESRIGGGRELRFGPIAEPDARELAGLLLNRTDRPPGVGPWRCAIAGGTRIVSLEDA